MPGDGVPAHLGDRGRRFWVLATAEFELTVSDTAILEQACAQLDLIGDLEALLVEQGLMVDGSRGQPRLSPIPGELRQARLCFQRLVDALSWPLEESDEGATPASRRAKKAADVRWGRVRLLEEKRNRPNAAS